MAHGFETHAELVRQALDIVGARFRRLQEALVWHQQGAGKVIRECQARARLRRRTGQSGRQHQRVDQLAVFEQADLRRHLEGALATRQRVGQPQDVLLGVKAVFAHHARVAIGQLHLDAVALQQAALQRVERAQLRIEFAGHQFGRPVQFIDIVLPPVQVFAHFLVRGGRRRAGAAAAVVEARGQRVSPLRHHPVAPLQ